MRGRLRDIARATHRRYLLIWHVEAGSVKLSERAGAIGMDSSLAQSLAGVILPGELTDFPNPRTNSHIERGRLQGIGHPPDKLPTRTLEIRDSRKAPQKPKTGEHRPISTSVTNSHTNPGHHRTPSHGCTNSHAKPGHHQPLDNLPKPPGIRAALKRPYTPDASAARPDTTKNRTPKWACGRCTIELPGPSPAFDA